MKFLFVAPRFHTNLYYRVIALQEAGHEVKSVVLYKGKSEYYKGVDVLQVKLSLISRFFIRFLRLFKKERLKSNLELRLQSPGKALRKIIASFEPDFILLKAFQNLLAIKTLQLSYFKRSKVLMLIQTDKVSILNSKKLFRLNLHLFKWLKVKAYITPVKRAETLFKAIGFDNCYYLPFVFPKQKNTKNEAAKTVVSLISVGKFVRRKEQLLLIESLDLLKGKLNFELILIGEIADKVYYENLLSEIKKRGLETQIKIRINVPYPEISILYKKADVFILPSYGEPAAYSPVEALAFGLPIIMSTESGTNCYIEQGKNGYIFEKKNAKDLASKIYKIAASREVLLDFGKNALLLATENHSLKSFSNKINKIIAEF